MATKHFLEKCPAIVAGVGGVDRGDRNGRKKRVKWGDCVWGGGGSERLCNDDDEEGKRSHILAAAVTAESGNVSRDLSCDC